MTAAQQAAARAGGAGLRRLAVDLDHMARTYPLPSSRRDSLRRAADELRTEADRREHDTAATVAIADAYAAELPR